MVMQRPANPRFSGAMAEWSCSGLQIRRRRFGSGSRLQTSGTDPSVEGLPPGEPVIVAAGMQGERASVVIEQSACGRWRSEEIIPESDSANASLRCLRTWSEHGTNTTRRGVKYRYKGMTGYDPKPPVAFVQYMSADGKTFYLFSSGGDCLSVARGRCRESWEPGAPR